MVVFIRFSYVNTAPIGDSVGDQSSTQGDPTSFGQEEWWHKLKGTKLKMGRELSNRLFADYSVKVDEFQNQVDFRHEVEVAYRFHRNFYIRAISELDSEGTLGRPPDRRALLENRWRFGLPKRKSKRKSDDKSSALPTPENYRWATLTQPPRSTSQP